MRLSRISNSVILRLPRYLRKLDDLSAKGVENISSIELGKTLGLTATQIRQDLSSFGEFGLQGFGYNVDKLRTELGHILGTYNNYSAILIGPGHLGTALVENFRFIIEGYTFLGAFTVTPSKIGTQIGGYPVYDVAKLPQFLQENHVDIAILTVPRGAAQELADTLIAANIRAIWNFTNQDLDMHGSATLVENIHFSDSLLVLTCNLSRKDDAARLAAED